MAGGPKASHWRALSTFVLGLGSATTLAYAVAIAQPPGEAHLKVDVPILSEQAQLGEEAFEEHCAHCHGDLAAGSASGPPLISPLYQPSRHGNLAFQRAVAMGVQSHHWQYGDMPPMGDLAQDDVAAVIRYVRELQRENGIH